jgi:hypothetical protein
MSSDVKGDTRNEIFASTRRIHEAVENAVNARAKGKDDDTTQQTQQTTEGEEGDETQQTTGWEGGGGGSATVEESGMDEAPKNPKSRGLWRSKGIAAQVMGLGRRIVEDKGKRR